MIKIYSAKSTDFTQADYTKQYSLLEHAIREKIDFKKSPAAKKNSLAGYILLYNAISDMYNKTEIEIKYNENGKPICDFCFFNISHSKGYVVCVVADEVVGIDVQKIKNISQREKYKFFNKQENDYVNSDIRLLSSRYIEIFTKKEAAVKMLGTTIACGATIDTFSEKFLFETYFNGDFVVTVCRQNN